MRGRPGVRGWLRLSRLDAADAARDVDDELELHIELRTRELMQQGYEAAQAELEARRLFARDNDTLRALYHAAQERNQHMRMGQQLDSWRQDIRYAARGLLRDPLLAVFIVLTLALGVGANVTAFSLVDRLLLRGPAHVQQADELVRLYARISNAAGDQTSSWIPYLNYRNLRQGMTSFRIAGAYRISEGRMGGAADARKIRLGQTLDAFFPLLGVRPVAGRLFATDEDAATAGALVVLNERLWRSEFASDPSAIGRSIIIADQPHTIVGVVPEDFSGTDVRRVDAWVLGDSRTAHTMNWHVLGRLRTQATLSSTSADALAVHQRSREQGPRWMRDAVLYAGPIHFDDSGREPLESTMARWLAAVSSVILLITFANVVNLLLVRLARHRRELAIRIALGSGRARIMRLLALEGILLALASGAASLIVAQVVEPIVQRALFADEAAWTFSLLDARVLLTLLGIVVVTGVVVGVVPAWQAGNPRLTAALKSGAQAGESNSRLRSSLTVLQAALSVVLLVGAGLFLRSLANVRALDLGVNAERVVVATADLPDVPQQRGRGGAAVAERDLLRRFLETVRRLPGVDAAAISVGMPLDGGSFGAGVWVAGMDSVPVLPFRGPHVSMVSGDYFRTVGTRLLRGRAFTDADREGTELVVIVNETMARALWPGRDALNACMRYGFADAPCARVVGVVADVHRMGLREERSLQYYIPLGQTTMFAGGGLVVRPTEKGALSWPALRQAMLSAEPSARAVEIELLATRLDGELRPLRLGLITFGLSGALALLVAVLGLYSLMSYLVAWRTREIGVRVALGASDAQVTRLVVSNGAVLAMAGVAVGLLLTLAGARWLQPHLFNTSARDPLVFAAVAVVLMLVALMAGVLPARRALRISPTEALRAE